MTIVIQGTTAQPAGVEDDVDTLQSASDSNVKAIDDDEDDDDDDKNLMPLYVGLLVCIALLVVVMVIMIVIVLILRRKAMHTNESTMSEDDKLALIKEGYVNPTYQFFDKSSSAH